MEIKDLATILTVVGTVITGIIYGWKKVGRPIQNFLKRVNEIETEVEGLQYLRKYTPYIEEKLNGTIRLLITPMFVCDPKGECILVNEAICKLFGATEQQMRGYGWKNFIHPDDREEAWQKWLDAVNSGGEDIKASYRIINGETSEEIDVTYHVILSRDDEKQVIVSVGNVKKKSKIKVDTSK